MDVGADADTNAIGLGDGGDARADAPILAISSRGGITGAACFDPATSTLSLLEDVSEDSAFSVCQMLLFQTNPGIVIANMRADAAMLAVLREPLRLSATTQHKIETRPSSEFAFEAGKTRLLGIRLARPNTPNRIDEQTHTHAHARSAAPTAAQRRESMQMTIEAVVCLDNREMVGAAGALLAFVAEAAFSGELALMDRPPRLPGVAEDVDAGFDAAGPAGEAAYGGAGRANLPYRARRGGRRAAALSLDGFVIHAVESIALSKMMQLSVNTLVSLRIFQDQRHPNIHRQSKKEGVLDFVRSKDAKTMLRQWLMRPLLDLDEIRERHRTVGWFTRPEMHAVRKTLLDSLKHLKSMPRLLSSMRFKLVLLDWQSLHQFMFHAVCVAACIRSQCGASGLEIAASTIESVPVALFQQLSQHINDVIDFDESKLAVRLVVKPDVDETLDSLKSTYNQLEEILSGVAAQVAPTLPAGIASSLNVVYFPQLGYLIAIRHPDGDLAAMCNDEDISGMKFQFSTSSVAYYKSESMFELDRELGDIHSDIVDRELEIMQQLREVVLQNAEQLFHTARVLTKLECLLALAEAAARFNYVCPTMTEEPIVHIEQGRHPLQELCVETFIANDTHLGCEGCGHGIETVAAASSADAAGTAALDTTAADETGQACPRAMLLTGANFSGKSVYLHQVALITIMAHAGSFVPAASATIGLTDRVLTRIQSDDSVSARKSTFLIDLHQAAAAMHNSSPRSLVVLDEFGKGTTSSDGIGLFCAVLESFVNRGASCPRVIAATHFHEILAHDLLRVPHGSVGLSHMRIIESPSREGTDAVSFLYELAPGRSMQSLGVHCARIAGLPDCINDRAKQVAECVMAGRRIPVVPDERDAARQHAADEIAQVLAECDLAAADLDAALWGPIRRFEPLFE